MEDFSLQGIVYIADRLASGKPGVARDPGNASVLSVKFSSEVSTRKESRKGLRLPKATLSKGITATFSLTLTDGNADNFGLGLYGTKNIIPAGNVAAGQDLLPEGLVAGDIVRLKYRNVSTVVLNDSAGAPAELVQGTNYKVLSPSGGLIQILDPGSFVQPFDPAYAYAAGINLTAFTQAAPEKYLMFDALNTVDGDSSRSFYELFRAKFDPVSELALLNDDFADISLTGSLLWDDANADDPAYGGFLRVGLPAEA